MPQGYIATTVQQYLRQFPVDENDVVHVEDGGWVNPAGDFGSPQSLQWNYPLQPNKAQVSKWVGESGMKEETKSWIQEGGFESKSINALLWGSWV